ncbi:MAG: ABC transporter permease [Candidatus Aenigmatarchaeota archaeon]
MELRPFFSIVSITFKERFVYKLDFLSSLMGVAFNLILFWFLWKAVFAASGSAVIQGFTFPMMVTYLSIVTVMRSYGYPHVEYSVENDVKWGFLGVRLTKPFSYPLWKFTRELGKTLFVILTAGAVGIIAAVLVFNISGPVSWLFFVSAAMGFIVNYLLAFITALWAFFTTGYIWGMRLARGVISDIFSGALIPLVLFPGFLKSIAALLPFQAVYHIPMSIYLGHVTGYALIETLLLQVFWIVLLVIIAAFAWKKALTRAVVQGG